MFLGATLFSSAFVAIFGFLAADALRSSKLRGIGWFVHREQAPFRYWFGVFAYSLNLAFALLFTIALASLIGS
ncbi:hypothetical protein WSK_4330 [Novosphingobium sp. Rr 2-17]|nr:hypothetical protein WSK_4330 [Novosphingobium sp. Rr 2-17]